MAFSWYSNLDFIHYFPFWIISKSFNFNWTLKKFKSFKRKTNNTTMKKNLELADSFSQKAERNLSLSFFLCLETNIHERTTSAFLYRLGQCSPYNLDFEVELRPIIIFLHGIRGSSLFGLLVHASVGPELLGGGD